MANDRMYIRCKGCGELHYLAKCYDDGYFTTHEGEELRQGLDDFFDRHKWCYRGKYYGGFELVYESDEDAESEDERIRKELKEAFEAYDIESKWNGIPIRSIFAWLEKQKEKSEIPIMGGDTDTYFDDLRMTTKPLTSREWFEEGIKYAQRLQKEQKPVSISCGHENDAEWSDEDADMLNCCISSVEEAKENRYAYKETDGNTSYDREIDWLKSLRPSWKPSEEQMEALKRASTNEYLPAKQFDILVSLYEQLKKLM